MKKLIQDLFIVLTPVVTVLCLVNYIGDPAHRFDANYEQKIVEMMKGGRAVTNVDNCDERKLKRLLIESNHDKHFDYLIFGSSRCMTISKNLTGANLLNLGVSGATIQDFLALLKICKENNITYDNVIISIDPGLLNCNNADKRWLTNKDYFEKITGHHVSEKKTQEPLIKTLFSGSYFQSSYISLLKKINGESAQLMIAEQEENENQTIFPEGAITYGVLYRTTPQNIVDTYANNGLRQEFSSFDSISEQYECMLYTLLDKVADKGQKITFITFPYMQGYYSRLIVINGIKEQEIYLRNLAKMRNYNYYGSLDPSSLGLTNKDFYDELHLRRETVAKLCQEYGIFN